MKVFIIDWNYKTSKFSYKDTCHYTAEYELDIIKGSRLNIALRLAL